MRTCFSGRSGPSRDREKPSCWPQKKSDRLIRSTGAADRQVWVSFRQRLDVPAVYHRDPTDGIWQNRLGFLDFSKPLLHSFSVSLFVAIRNLASETEGLETG